jgi:hypothetical protein
MRIRSGPLLFALLAAPAVASALGFEEAVRAGVTHHPAVAGAQAGEAIAAAEHAATRPDHPAVIMTGSGQQMTYGEMEAESNRLPFCRCLMRPCAFDCNGVRQSSQVTGDTSTVPPAAYSHTCATTPPNVAAPTHQLFAFTFSDARMLFADSPLHV